MNATSTGTRHATRNGASSVRAEADTTENVYDMHTGEPVTAPEPVGYRDVAHEYYAKGWMGPFPLAAKKKWPPPKGFTGREGEYPDAEQIQEWCDKRSAKASIGLRMGTVEVDDVEYDVLGIDVDDRTEADGKVKNGYSQLRELEAELGRLPKTWTSSARADGKSGIRFFRVPAGLQWQGTMGSAIDVIQKNHRYAVVYPSVHPEGTRYQWYCPGRAPDGHPTAEVVEMEPRVRKGKLWRVRFVAREVVGSPGIPDARTLPELPARWVDRFTGDRTLDLGVAMDMDSTPSQLEKWARKSLPREKVMCRGTESALDKWKAAIADDPSSHDKITSGHWELFRLAGEGCKGWRGATRQLEEFWTDAVRDARKRSETEAKAEVQRSREGALRRLKGEVDETSKVGRTVCTCWDEASMDYGAHTPPGALTAKAPGDYDQDDDGNAEHLIDLFREDLRWVGAFGRWVSWDGKRWTQDEHVGRQRWRVVKNRQKAYTVQLESALADAVVVNGGDTSAQEVKDAKAKLDAWRKHVKKSGENNGADAALVAARSFPGVAADADVFDSNEKLLAVENGVIELNTDGYAFRDVRRDDYLTYNTGVPYLPWDEQTRRGGDLTLGVEAWTNYLDTFLPDMELRRFTQKVFGYCLLGRNTERLAVFLYGGTSTGKSTMLNAVIAALGGYASSNRIKMLMGGGKDLNPELVEALPRRIVTSSEAGDVQLNADEFKRVTGADELQGELKGSNGIVRRVPAFTPVFATNTPPEIKGIDDAVARRMLTIPFTCEVSRGEENRENEEALRAYGMTEPPRHVRRLSQTVNSAGCRAAIRA